MLTWNQTRSLLSGKKPLIVFLVYSWCYIDINRVRYILTWAWLKAHILLADSAQSFLSEEFYRDEEHV